MRRQARSEVVGVRLTPADRKAIEAAADRSGVTLSEFMRAAALTVMLAGLDRHALAQFTVGVVGALSDVALKLRGVRLATE